MIQNSIRIVDNLAEITSHHDRHVLEKSLLKTLNELFPAQDLRLFRVREYADNHEVTLLAFCVNSVIVSSDDTPRLLPNESEISGAISRSIEKGDVEVAADSTGGWNVVCPAFDSHGDIFAVLLIATDLVPSASDQRLVYGILRVYSNYLALIEKTQKDKLTGLYNRETLDNEITKILVRQSDYFSEAISSPNDSRRRSYAIKYWLGLIDIDHFKAINDGYGHLYGDEVIILVARLMTSGCIRDDDLVYRYGGEEFVVLLKSPTEEDAMLTFERIRQLVAEHSFPQLKQVTISIGFVEVGGQQSSSDVIGEADEALYYAKHHGRNQVQSHRQLVDDGKIEHISQLTHGDVELF
ncbi:GGDEF domain-containing protein [Methylophaga sp. OBS4]|uniref:GGDEF domain-containing protein n=1 Tax=Methylophaga sp. OBS4 TaxID=2991935 RepID=UPI002254AB86|nr:GGDEF domain-containing protein [Methylophaga sp. OBS4]MCX4186790.1 GGDEF domain-containing protein [Methylophaga sp. OBS4]